MFANLFGDDNNLFLILIVLLLFGGFNNECGCGDRNRCGSGGIFGGDNIILIILLLLLLGDTDDCGGCR